MDIIYNLISTDKYSSKCPYKMEPEFFVIHNLSYNETAEQVISRMNSNKTKLSIHYSIDDKFIVQGIPENRSSWNINTDSNNLGNRKGIGIDICYGCNDSKIDKYLEAEDIAAKFIATRLLEKNQELKNIEDIAKVVKKKKDFDKTSDSPYRTCKLGWDRFLEKIKFFIVSADGIWVRQNPIVENYNPFYNKTSTMKGTWKAQYPYPAATRGYSTCCFGSPTRSNANVLCNCVGFANGAFNETYCINMQLRSGDDNPFVFKEYYDLNCDANLFITRAKNRGLTIKSKDGVPPVGGLIVWGGTANHVAYISKVILDGNNDRSKDKIIVLQAGYDTPSWSVEVVGGYECSQEEYTRGTDSNWQYRGTCLGFIVNPAIPINPDNEDYIEGFKENNPEITDIRCIKPNQLQISGKLNSNSDTKYGKFIYKWGINNSEQVESAPDGYVIVADEFDIMLKKKRSQEYISVLPVRIDSVIDEKIIKGDLFINSTPLPISYGAIDIQTEGGIKKAIPDIFSESKWNNVVPTIYKDNNWYELYNTDAERIT